MNMNSSSVMTSSNEHFSGCLFFYNFLIGPHLKTFLLLLYQELRRAIRLWDIKRCSSIADVERERDRPSSSSGMRELVGNFQSSAQVLLQNHINIVYQHSANDKIIEANR